MSIGVIWCRLWVTQIKIKLLKNFVDKFELANKNFSVWSVSEDV
jgi:hypothetical protein